MSILRQDPTTKDWVIIATDRGQRPDDFLQTVEEAALPTYDSACPFCSGQEHLTPSEDETKHYFLWHIQILPRLTTIAGFELGSGIIINTILPEDAASYLKKNLQ